MTSLVPAVARSRALAVGAARWLDDLPEIIAGLERDWSIAVGRPYQTSTEAFVAEASRSWPPRPNGSGVRPPAPACPPARPKAAGWPAGSQMLAAADHVAR